MLELENYKTMLIARHDDGFAVVTLNRPERLTMQSEDHREAVRGFQEKRPAQFTGK